jgi:microcystin-dependent protein
MAEPFLSEIRIFSFGFAPKGWALCNGQLLPINQNQALFSLLGTTFGGDGRVNFGLPNLQGNVPIGVGNGHTLGEKGGEQGHTVSMNEMPTHTHTVGCVSGGAANTDTNIPAGKLFGHPNGNLYNTGSPTPLIPQTVTNVGGSQAHLNMQPFLTLTFGIALQGIFPSPN